VSGGGATGNDCEVPLTIPPWLLLHSCGSVDLNGVIEHHLLLELSFVKNKQKNNNNKKTRMLFVLISLLFPDTVPDVLIVATWNGTTLFVLTEKDLHVKHVQRNKDWWEQ